ncbi:MAG TPA: hypothetical protein VHK89_02470 [Actinomycetota bacterium]|nr:hypothetical protein [Actinomycetota bacterium]
MASERSDEAPPPVPLGLVGLLREGWPLYRSRFSSLFALFVAAYALIAILSLVEAAGGEGATRVLLELILPISVQALAGSLATAAAIVVLRDAQAARYTGAASALAGLRPRWKEVAAAGLLAAMLSLLAYILPPFSFLAALGPSFFAMLYGPPMLVHAIVLEDKTLQQAGPRARALLSRQWARLVLYLLVMAVGAWVFAGVVTSLAGRLLQLFVPDEAFDPTLLVVYLLVLGALVPFLVATVYAAFLNLRAVKDAPGGAPA